MKKKTALLKVADHSNLVVPQPLRWIQLERDSCSTSPDLADKQDDELEKRTAQQPLAIWNKKTYDEQAYGHKSPFSFFASSYDSSVESVGSNLSSPLSMNDLHVLEPYPSEPFNSSSMTGHCLSGRDAGIGTDFFENAISFERVEIQSLPDSPSLFEDTDSASSEAAAIQNPSVPVKMNMTLSDRFFYYCCCAARSHRRVNVLQPSL